MRQGRPGDQVVPVAPCCRPTGMRSRHPAVMFEVQCTINCPITDTHTDRRWRSFMSSPRAVLFGVALLTFVQVDRTMAEPTLAYVARVNEWID